MEQALVERVGHAEQLGPALDAEGLQVGQVMYLRAGFTATGSGRTGAVNLYGAHISGGLECLLAGGLLGLIGVFGLVASLPKRRVVGIGTLGYTDARRLVLPSVSALTANCQLIFSFLRKHSRDPADTTSRGNGGTHTHSQGRNRAFQRNAGSPHRASLGSMVNRRTNILISHVYSSHNNGDAAILSAQIAELRRTFPDAHLSILSIDQIEPGYTFEGISVSNALMYGSVAPTNGKLKKLLLAFSMMACTSLWMTARQVIHVSLPLPRIWAEPIQLLVDSDMQVCVGGGYLRAKDDWVSTLLLVLLFHQVWLAKSLGVPVYLYAQSFGPYPKRIQRKIATAGLGHADLILVREAKSMALLESMGLTGDHVTKVPDSAFMFEPQVQLDARTVLGTGRPHEIVVGITVRSWLHGANQVRYERAMAEFIDWLSRRDGMRVAVIAQVTSAAQNDDDRVVGRRIRELTGEKSNIIFLDERYTHHEVRQLFGALTYLVGTRFHSVIFALSAGVPAIAIEYEHKTSGIMQDLGLDEWVLPMEEVTADKLVDLFDRLLSQTVSYQRQLSRALPPYIERGHESADIIQRAYLARLLPCAARTCPWRRRCLRPGRGSC